MGSELRHCYSAVLIGSVFFISSCSHAVSRKEKELNLRLTYVAFKEFFKGNGALPSLNDNKAYFTSYFGKQFMNWRVVIQLITPLGSHDHRLDEIQIRKSIEQSGAMFFESGDQRIYANLPAITGIDVRKDDACFLFAYLPKDDFPWYEDEASAFRERLEEYCSTGSNQEVMFLLNDGSIGTFKTRHFNVITPLLDPNSSFALRQDALKYLQIFNKNSIN